MIHAIILSTRRLSHSIHDKSNQIIIIHTLYFNANYSSRGDKINVLLLNNSGFDVQQVIKNK